MLRISVPLLLLLLLSPWETTAVAAVAAAAAAAARGHSGLLPANSGLGFVGLNSAILRNGHHIRNTIDMQAHTHTQGEKQEKKT